MVYIKGDIPYNFMSIDSSGEQKAYLVSLDYVGCDDMSTGKDYAAFEQVGNDLKTVVFGEDDVYVYDSTGTLYYAKGIVSDGENHYGAIGGDNNNSIKIIGIKKEVIDDKVNVSIEIRSEKEIELVKVRNDGFDGNATDDDNDNIYEITIDKNGDYEIIVEDEDGNQVRESFRIDDLESGSSSGIAPTVTVTVTNGILNGDSYTVTDSTIKMKIKSDTAKYMYISSTNNRPDSWLPFSDTVEKTYTKDGAKELYVWVKDKDGLICDTPYVVKINVDTQNGSGNGNTPGQPPEENASGSIEFLVTPGNETWSMKKQLTIIFNEGEQLEGNYQFEYRTKSGLSDWGRWTVVYDNVVNIDIVRNNTQVQARIVYTSTYKNEEVSNGEITVKNIDTTAPKLESLKIEYNELTKANEIVGTASDSESRLHTTAPYFASTQEINFKYITDVNSFAWQSSPRFEVDKNAKYYFYVRDNANNVGHGSINAEAKDNIAPVVNVTAKNTLDYADIFITAEDNIGIVGYAITKNDSTTVPTVWSIISEEDYVEINYNNIRADDKYTAWVKDAAGNINSATVTIKLNQFPVLDINYPKNLLVTETFEGKFEVVYTQVGYPDEYEYQWMISRDNKATWSPIAGANDKVYTFIADFDNNDTYIKCQITHARGVIESAAAYLEIDRITTTPPDSAITEDKELVAGGVIINSGASETSSATLDLNIIAINAAEMSISETSTKGTWQTYRENVSYTLSDITAGTKTIYVWIRDSEGNEYSGAMTSQIEYKP